MFPSGNRSAFRAPSGWLVTACCRPPSWRPGHCKVIPLTPEFVATQDAAEKQDCERNAVKRWFSTHGARLAPLRPIVLGDDPFACHPVAKMVTDADDDFIFTAKQSSHKALYGFIEGAELARHEEKVRRRATKETFRYRWIEAVPIRYGDKCSRLQRQRRRNRRLWPREMENRERKLQRHEKPRLRTRT